jgi:hypothetical protein
MDFFGSCFVRGCPPCSLTRALVGRGRALRITRDSPRGVNRHIAIRMSELNRVAGTEETVEEEERTAESYDCETENRRQRDPWNRYSGVTRAIGLHRVGLSGSPFALAAGDRVPGA